MRGLKSSGRSVLPTISRGRRRLRISSQALPRSSSSPICEFAVLGLSPFASADDVKRAYKRLALKHHPDVIRGKTGPAKEEVFKEIKSAYESLMQKLEVESMEQQTGLGDYDEWEEWEDWMGFEGGFPVFSSPF
ncbi:chaperone DnaJ-domain superfamily protein [Wolffia australiana]